MTQESFASVYFDRESRRFQNITPEMIAYLQAAYPGVNVHVEFAKMQCWLLSSKGARRKGNTLFIMRWLAKAPKTMPVEGKAQHCTESLLRLYNEYDEALWKDCAYLLELNTKHTTPF